MKKKALALSVLAAISTQASAFQFDTDGDWSIRWDNQLKGNMGFRTGESKRSVVDPTVFANARIADDGDFSVNRKAGGVTTSRIDLRSELDVVWRQDFGFRISGAGWWDPTYDNSDNPKSGTLPKTGGLAYDYSWAGLTYAPGDYSNEAEWQHQAGGELLDAFVFGNWNIGSTALGVRAGRHTIFWGQSLLGNGALTGIAGSMTALDSSKALSVPGTEAQELFMPSNKISTVFQATDNLTFNAYYEFEHRVNRNPETGSYMSPVEVLTENSECFVLAGGVNGGPRTCFKVLDNKVKDSGEYGFNVQYTIDAWDLETSWVYINGSDRTVAGVYGTAGIDPEIAARYIKPWDEGGANAAIAGQWGWAYKDNVETFGLALGKQMFDISFGMDIVYRKNAGLNPNFSPSLTRAFADPTIQPEDYGYSDDDYPGATGNIWGVVINGLGFLNGDWGLWDGGTWIVEYTTSWLDDYSDANFGGTDEYSETYANPLIHKNRVTSQVAAVFRPTWYQVFPGWDMTIPASVSYGIDGEQPPQGTVIHEELGNGNIGVEFLVDQVWTLDAKYNFYFGPTANGTTGPLNDRDFISLTVKRTW
jgi:hypothetical protein